MSTSETPDESKLVSALARGINILNCFSPVQYELSAKEIGEKTGLPKPTLSRLLETLSEYGLIRYSDRLSKYVPGAGLLNLSAPVLQRMTIRQIARPLMQELADYISGQVQLVMGSKSKMCYVEIAQGANSKIYRPEVGVRMSISRTSTWKKNTRANGPGLKNACKTRPMTLQPWVFAAGTATSIAKLMRLPCP